MMREKVAQAGLPRRDWLVGAPWLLCAGIVAASFLRSDLTTNDFERFEDLRLTALFFVLFAVAGIGYAVLCLELPQLQSMTVIAGAAGALVLLLVSFPVGSKDAFLYAFDGKIWATYHANPYRVSSAEFPADPWQPFVQMIWSKQTVPYGPLFVWQTRLVATLAGEHLFLAVWLHKAIAAAACAVAMSIGTALLRPPTPRDWSRVALLAWNPLLLFESAASGHIDAGMAALLLGAVWAHGRGGRWRIIVSPTVLALAIWYKWYALLFVPVFAIAVVREGGAARGWRWMFWMLLTVTATGALLLAPLADGIPVLLQRLVGDENLRQVFPLQLSPPLAVLLRGLDAVGWSSDGLRLFDLIRMLLFAVSALGVLVSQWHGRIGLVESACLLSLAFMMLLVTLLWPWHLTVPVAFAMVAGARRWDLLGLALTLVGLFSYFLTFLWSTVLLALVAAALWVVHRSAAR